MNRGFLNLLVIISAVYSLGVCLYNYFDASPGYEFLWIQPLAFLLTYILFLVPTIKTNRFPITSSLFVFAAWMRCVLIPMASALSRTYNGVSYIYVSENSAHIAVFLVAYELFVTSVFLYISVGLSKGHILRPDLTKELVLGGNKIIYVILFLIAIALYFLIGRDANLIRFFALSAENTERFGDVTTTADILVRQIILCAFIFSFAWATSYCKKWYDITRNKSYVYLAILVAMLNVGVIIGERRSSQLYTGLVVMFILVAAFREHKKKIIVMISTTTLGILLLMSIYKHLTAFYYGSYVLAVQATNVNLVGITETLQSYFYGTQNIAAAIEFRSYANLEMVNMLYDFGRSTFGISFLLKEQMLLTGEAFNYYIYGEATATGHVLSGLAYGYIYFGAILSPLIVCLNTYISLSFEKLFSKVESYEMKYIVGYILLRFSIGISASTPPLISLSTSFLFTAGMVYLLAFLFKNIDKARRA